MTDELSRIDTYCDTVPRAAASTEQVGPFTLFVARPGRSFYSRPSAGTAPAKTPADRDDFDRVLARYWPGNKSCANRGPSNGSTTSTRIWQISRDRQD